MLRRGIESDILPYCLTNRIGVIVYSPMAAGILSGAMTRERAMSLPSNDWRTKNPDYQEPRLSRNLGLVEELRTIGARYSTSPGAVAIAWTLRQPAVTGAIVGFRSARQVDGMLAAATLRLAAEEVARIDQLTGV
jgi:aryl-alcohol dehydrogenase-like predicted oxidoreductase